MISGSYIGQSNNIDLATSRDTVDPEGCDMRRVVLMTSTSIDGFVSGPHGHAGALPEPEKLKRSSILTRGG
jgi:hypothetical protein